MASFAATLTIGGQFETDINAFTLDVHQSLDELGRPASPTSGGQMTITFNTTDDPLVTGWMLHATLQRNGRVTFYSPTGQTMKVIEFTNAYCIDMEESFDGTDNWVQMETTLVISPETIAISHIPHDNNWPPIEAMR